MFLAIGSLRFYLFVHIFMQLKLRQHLSSVFHVDCQPRTWQWYESQKDSFGWWSRTTTCPFILLSFTSTSTHFILIEVIRSKNSNKWHFQGSHVIDQGLHHVQAEACSPESTLSGFRVFYFDFVFSMQQKILVTWYTQRCVISKVQERTAFHSILCV